jgi:hypothetical protein
MSTPQNASRWRPVERCSARRGRLAHPFDLGSENLFYQPICLESTVNERLSK